MKCMLRVATRSDRRMICSARKEMLVAWIKVGVGPGVKIEDHRSLRKVAIIGRCSLSLAERRECDLQFRQLLIWRLLAYAA